MEDDKEMAWPSDTELDRAAWEQAKRDLPKGSLSDLLKRAQQIKELQARLKKGLK